MTPVVALSEGYYQGKIRKVGESFSIASGGDLGLWMTTNIGGQQALEAIAMFEYRATLETINPKTYRSYNTLVRGQWDDGY